MSHSQTGFVFAQFTSDFDGADRLINSSRIANSTAIAATEIASFTYDRAGQLTGVSRSIAPTAETYSYDAAGNRSGANGASYSNTANNRLSSDGTYNYLYDDEGNITRKTLIANANVVTYYSYDHRNRLTGLSEFNQYGTNVKNVAYAYDVFDRRVQKSIDPDGGGAQPYDSTFFVYDGDDVALALKTNGTLSNRYLHGPAVDEILADENQYGGVLWALKDQLGNVRDLVDHSGGLYNHIDYDTFGRVTYELKPASQGHLVHAYGFQSRERDQESALNYHRNRYYNPSTGRWISEDPIGFIAGDGNLARFVGSAPTNYSDPYGLDDFDEGVIDGFKEQFWATLDFVNPLTLDDAVRDLVNAPYGDDWQKAKDLANDPVDYLGKRGKVICDSTTELLSTNHGRGRAFSYALSFAASRRLPKALGLADEATEAASKPRAGQSQVFRAVSDAEYQDILRTGRFRQGPPNGRFRLVHALVPDDAPSLYRL
jgi:RHS repeat-associated protein